MDPKPTRAPARTVPAPAPRAAAPASAPRMGALRGADRKAPLAEQEARLAPPAAGQPRGTAAGQAARANAAAGAVARRSNGGGSGLAGLRARYSEAAAGVDGYLPIMMTYSDNAIDARRIEEAKVDRTHYRDAEARLAEAMPLWSLATELGRTTDARFQGAMGTLEAAGLAAVPEGEVAHRLDVARLGAESRAYADEAGRQSESVDRPKTDGGGAGAAMSAVRAAALQVTSAASRQRALYFQREAEGIAASKDSRALGVLDRIVSFVGSVEAVHSGPSAGSVQGLIGQIAVVVMMFDYEKKAAAARAENANDNQRDEDVRAGWAGLESALLALQNAREAFEATTGKLRDETATTTSHLVKAGRRMDMRAASTRPAAAASTEHHGANGQHMGALLEAQRMVVAARESWAGVAPAIGQAASAVRVSQEGTPTEQHLRGFRSMLGAPQVEIENLGALRQGLEARYAQREARLADAVRTITANLGEAV